MLSEVKNACTISGDMALLASLTSRLLTRTTPSTGGSSGVGSGKEGAVEEIEVSRALY